MLFKSRIIAFSAAAVLAVAGGVYALMPDAAQNSSSTGNNAVLDQTAAKTDVVIAQKTVGGPSHDEAKNPGANVTADQQPASQAQPVQAPKRLTKQQLMPPPLSEDEKLQKAAELESNF